MSTVVKSTTDPLNRQQRQAVEHGVVGTGANVAGPLLVIAGAGTGKTSVLAHRVANLIVHGADPTRILLLTFTRLAAEEMKKRVAGIVGATNKSTAVEVSWSGTFHAVANRLLRAHARRVGLDANFNILDRGDAADLMGLARKKLGYDKLRKRFPDKAACLEIYSYKVNSCRSLKEVLETRFPDDKPFRKKLRKLFVAYVAEKQRNNVLDYDDLLLYWAEILAVPKLAKRIGAMFDHVLVDEFQDTNALQSLILRRLKGDGRGLTVVGDDAQAIYSFRAAEARNILAFPDLFQPPATIVKLEQNYRSTKPILKASNAVINEASEGFKKTLRTTRKGGGKPRLITVADDQAQAAYIADQVKGQLENGRTLSQQAVLFRASHHSAALEIELNARRIPFVKFGGIKFMEAAHIKDVLAVLRWFENQADQIAGRRVLALLPRVGVATADKMLSTIGTRDVATTMASIAAPRQAAPALKDLTKLARCLTLDDAAWAGQLERVRRWYEPILESKYDTLPQRRADLDQLQAIAAGYSTRQTFLAELTLDPPTKTTIVEGKDTIDDVLTLSTIHSVKGREWQAVTVLNAIDGCIPSSRAETAEELEEERRLLYVAMTRAKSDLTLTMPWCAGGFGKPRDATNMRTPFIDDDMLRLFERRTWRPADAADDDGTSNAEVDLMARIRAWSHQL
ncbi:MAG: ATP-dependent helicase [Hyphomicrobiaceae bacterium]